MLWLKDETLLLTFIPYVRFSRVLQRIVFSRSFMQAPIIDFTIQAPNNEYSKQHSRLKPPIFALQMVYIVARRPSLSDRKL